MGLVAWIRRHALGLVLTVLVVTVGLVLIVGGIGALLLLPFSEEVPISAGAPLFDLLGQVFVPLLVAFVLLVILTLVLTVGACWLFVRRLKPGPRAYYWLGRLERSSDLLAQLHLSALLSGPDGSTTSDDQQDRAIADLKERYVHGDLSDEEFERGLERVFKRDDQNQRMENEQPYYDLQHE